MEKRTHSDGRINDEPIVRLRFYDDADLVKLILDAKLGIIYNVKWFFNIDSQ